jgi:hypothetical protein
MVGSSAGMDYWHGNSYRTTGLKNLTYSTGGTLMQDKTKNVKKKIIVYELEEILQMYINEA